MNRSIQVEGAFAVLKEDMKLRKLKVRSKKSVLKEICLFCIAYNFNRYLSRNINNRLGTTLHSLKVAQINKKYKLAEIYKIDFYFFM